MPLAIVVTGVALLLLLMIRFRLNGFIAIILVTLVMDIMKRTPDEVMATLNNSITIIAMILLVIGGGESKQVLVDSGIEKYIATLMENSHLPPVLLAWLIAAALRIALGSATVAAITASGITAPLTTTTNTTPELMVIAIGSSSVIFLHVNDPGFWLFKEYFSLSIAETFKSWAVLETIISMCGLGRCFLLSMFI